MLRLRQSAANVVFALTLAVLTVPAEAGDAGQAAFEARDYGAAHALWRDEAAAGSRQAMFGLGLIHDLGLGRPRDPAAAFRWYARAADAGLPAAMFNVAVMLDAGAGVERRPAAAALWYARAAAMGHARAKYNLGLMYADGVGVPQNADLARYWLAGAELPAAVERLKTLKPATPPLDALSAPTVLLADMIDGEAVIVWTARPGPPGARFHVTLANAAGRTTVVTEASAIRLTPPAGGGPFKHRVSRVDPETSAYAASAWSAYGAAEPTASAGLVTFVFGADDPEAARLAELIAPALTAGGLETRLLPSQTAPKQSGVAYGFPTDADIARRVAGFLPSLSPDDAVQASANQLSPGEIQVNLRFRFDRLQASAAHGELAR